MTAKASTLVETFDSLNPALWSTLGSATVTGGYVSLGGGSNVTSVDDFDLDESHLTARVYFATGSGGWPYMNSAFGFFGSAPNHIFFYRTGSEIKAAVYYGTYWSSTYNPTAHACLRIKKDGNNCTFWTSKNGVQWTLRATADVSTYDFSSGKIQAYTNASAAMVVYSLNVAYSDAKIKSSTGAWCSYSNYSDVKMKASDGWISMANPTGADLCIKTSTGIWQSIVG